MSGFILPESQPSSTDIGTLDVSKQINQESSKITYYSVKKTIAKLKRTKSKMYQKRALHIEPIRKNIIIVQQQRYLLFSYVEIEGLYRDVSNIEDCSFFDLSCSCMQVKRLSDSSNKYQTIYTSPTIKSGLKEFSFLIKHFQTLMSPVYIQLADVLSEYQDQCITQQQHLRELKDKIKSRIIDEEQILKDLNSFEDYIKAFIDREFSNSDFIGYFVFSINPEDEDMNLKSFTFSQALLSIAGYDVSLDQIDLPSLVNLSEMLGLNRIQNVLNQLRLLTGNVKKVSLEQDIITVDGIKITLAIDYSYIDWEDHPSYLHRNDTYAFVMQAYFGLNQIEAILKIREERARECQIMENNFVNFEKQVKQEIFLEKFYPKRLMDKQNQEDGQIERNYISIKNLKRL